MVVFDESFARALRDSIEQEIRERAHAVRRMVWRRRSWLARVAGWFAYAYTRFAMGVAGITGRWL